MCGGLSYQFQHVGTSTPAVASYEFTFNLVSTVTMVQLPDEHKVFYFYFLEGRRRLIVIKEEVLLMVLRIEDLEGVLEPHLQRIPTGTSMTLNNCLLRVLIQIFPFRQEFWEEVMELSQLVWVVVWVGGQDNIPRYSLRRHVLLSNVAGERSSVGVV